MPFFVVMMFHVKLMIAARRRCNKPPAIPVFQDAQRTAGKSKAPPARQAVAVHESRGESRPGAPWQALGWSAASRQTFVMGLRPIPRLPQENAFIGFQVAQLTRLDMQATETLVKADLILGAGSVLPRRL